MSEPVVIVTQSVNRVTVTTSAPNQVVVSSPGIQGPPPDLTDNVLRLALGLIIDGGGVEIQNGIKGWCRVPVACTIEDWEIVADQAGHIVVDIWRAAYSDISLPASPSAAQSIAASAKPSLSGANKATNNTLAGWSQHLAAGDYVFFTVESCTDITRCSVSLTAIKDN